MDNLTQIQSIVTFAWWIALSFSVVVYVVLDGADLGAGVFSLFVRNEHERGAIMAAMAGTWDANETWLIVAGGVLFATFPFVYGSAFSYLLVPLALALWGMITRAVALEFRHLAEPRWQRFSDYAFGVSSLTVAFFGGMALGAVMKGFPLTHEAGTVPTYVGGALRFISPFSVWTGIASVVAVTLGGVLFIRARFHHGEPIRRQAARWSNVIFYLALATAVITVIYSMAIFPWAARKWLGPNFWIWAIVLLAVIVAVGRMRMAANRDRDLAALIWFIVALGIMAVSFMVTLYPWLIPGTWTIYAGASPSVSLFTFTLAMGGFFPVMIMYNAYQIWVFRERISALAGYH
ncbi:MAG TPA: cytochrome d ubiquinol oxidase subunit II [Acidocella sp.]|jgi:cytochrome d ubiquinol oxidase subunit II|uniref:cytochrome d ubiquinol oxidase subunit II n=1 Tax=Acidocella sp. TaxID=50710 RepID=UPI002C76B6F7|nr:cytochrome d ubiquinol oxidase subunit II [Acidocella sp.]HVE23147.1 cytochrome d ubiquinol oxidase subunit II [Acidocella sp.]